MRTVFAISKILGVVAWTLTLLSAHLYGLAFRTPLRERIPVRYHNGLRRILGLSVDMFGRRQIGTDPILYVANHSSWLDIVVLSCVIPGSFVSKSEVKKWPIFGQLARLQRSVFIERRSNLAANHRDEIRDRLNAGDKLILFPEGTSSDGNRVLPFKSALFAVAERQVGGKSLTVQPVSVAYTKLDNMPLGRHLRPLFTWYGDMALGGHLWRMLGLGPLTVTVTFHDPVSIADFGNRKALAEHCRKVVAAGLSNALTGRAQWILGSNADVSPETDRGVVPLPIGSPLS
ncbi:MAG: lysophospholipid acyltransferase family protein [Proteobacteria bacterium]|nr:lysophospholipid acyltransferase family protein [Pseudomonadota bacterium]